MRDTYVRRVTVVNVIDGDTFLCDVQLGFYVTVRMSCRLAGVNTPEKNEPGGTEARHALTGILSQGVVTVESVKADKYAGRFDAVVTVTGSGSESWPVAQWMIDRGYAVPWSGKGPRPLVPWPPAGLGTGQR